jgi:DNA-binding SARP family transcriptional activator
MELSLHFLGTFNAILDGEPITRFEADTARALLAYLTLNCDSLHRRDFLAALFWPDLEQTAALHALRQALSRLRGALREREAAIPLLLIDRHAIQCNPERPFQLDVRRFEELLTAAAAHSHRRRGACPVCLTQLAEAADLYRGDLLAGFHLDSLPFEEWLLLRRERLHAQALDSLYELTEAALRRGAYGRAQQYARQQLALESWREEAWQQLLRALSLAGQRSAALAQYAICQQTLAEELGVEPARETQRLYAAIRDERPSPALSIPPYHLPAPFSPLVGRERALATLAAQLNAPDGRLLSLVGPGGAGKTRLALALAEAVRGDFADGIFFAPLAAVTSPDLILPALARALNLSLHAERPLAAQLYAYLENREVLLICDNFEHLTASGALLLDLLRRAPRLTCLVASRERLNAPGETVFPVDGLAYAASAPAAAAPPGDAERLFMSVAARLAPGVNFDAADRTAIQAICRLVDGNPLAIELAAAWTRLLPCSEIAAEIERNLDFLAAPGPGRPERHHSLRAVFDHSWKLLADREQVALCRLAVLRGPFDREAARQVADAPPPLLAAL